MSAYVGDFRTGKTIRKMWNSTAIAGESITRATNGTISVYKDGNITQSTTGVTDTEDFDNLTGVHLVAIDTSSDGTFYSAGSEFEVVLSAATIDGKTINASLFSFSLENRSGLMPTTDGRKLDVSTGGEAGVDWANVGSPTTTLNLSGTTVKTATDVETDTQDIQSRLPAALTGAGNIKADALALSGDTTAADNAESFFDGTGYAGTNNVIPLVTTTTTATNLTTNNDKTGYGLSSAAVQAIWDALTSALTTVGSIGKLLVDNINATISSRSTYAGGDTSGTTTLLSRLSSTRATNLDNLDATVSSRLASASYTAPDNASVTAIKAKTDQLTFTTANQVDAGVINKTGFRLSTAGVDDVLDEVVEGTYTMRQMLKLFASALASKVSGAGTTTITFRDIGDSKDRIVATVDTSGNRSAITLDVS